MTKLVFAILCFVSLFPNLAIAEGPAVDNASKAGGENEHRKDKPVHSSDDSHVSDPAAGSDAFCDSIIDPARERRYYLKKRELEALLALVTERAQALDKRATEHKEWLRRREEFAKRATENLVEIYSTMKPEAAAARLSELDKGLAASLLLAIAPRQASGILNEMDEKTAAELTSIMSASARTKDPS